MAVVVVAAAALLASGLTMFSGFGLGTLLLPVLALFMPVELAVAATALVHGANSGVYVLKLGGVLSGFFGGLSGHQGALRSAFLAKVGISPQAFVGTNAIIGLLVDLVRISAYAAILFGEGLSAIVRSREGALVAVAALAAFAGVIIGKRVLHKITMAVVQRITGALLLVIAALLGLGVI